VFLEGSFSWALLEAKPIVWLAVALAVSLAVWMAIRGVGGMGWREIDPIGGLRWVVIGCMIGLAWPYGAHPYNHYYDQAHLLDRGLVFLFMAASLCSPIWIVFFCFMVALSRLQTYHAIAGPTAIIDEMPLRVLGAVACAGLWSPAASALERWRGRRFSGLGRVLAAPPLGVIVFAVLCLIAGFYVYPGIAKLDLGERPFDWVLQNHLENLFIGAYLNGWNPWIPEATALRLGALIETLSIPVSLATLLLELAMLFVAVWRPATVLLLIGVIVMHFCVLALTGVFFWTWTLVEISLVLWMIARWRAPEIWAGFSPRGAGFSFILIGVLTFAFGTTPLSWWNTRWHTMIELDAVGADRQVYRLPFWEFYPFLLTTFRAGYSPSLPGMYGGTWSQDVMRRLQVADPVTIRRKTEAFWQAGGPELQDEKVDSFMKRFFYHHNLNLGRGLIELPPYPTIRIRFPRDGIRYRGQTPVAAVRIRFVENFYTGGSIFPLRNEVIHTVQIPRLGEVTEESLEVDSP
jgi:hypothetical protein